MLLSDDWLDADLSNQSGPNFQNRGCAISRYRLNQVSVKIGKCSTIFSCFTLLTHSLR